MARRPIRFSDRRYHFGVFVMHWMLLLVVMNGLGAPVQVGGYFESKDLCEAARAVLTEDLKSQWILSSNCFISRGGGLDNGLPG